MKESDFKAKQLFKLNQFKNEGIDIPALSKENHAKLRKQLLDRDLVPDNEKSLYGSEMLNSLEQPFFDHWVSEIILNFMGLHGTEEWSLIEKSRGLVPVADRKRAQKFYSNSHTVGNADQEVLYFVLGIGDRHETPQFLSNYSGLIKIKFSDIPESQREIFNHMFIGGHRTEYHQSRKYCDLKAGTTVISVSYDKKSLTKVTTFTRDDGVIIQESLNYNDEIISHDNNINEIFIWLGLKLIQYLRFIGGDFQRQILQSRNIKEISAAFHSLFPSYRFPELKLMMKKLPLNAPFVSIEKYHSDQYITVHQLHKSVLCYDVETTRELLMTTNVNTPNASNQSPIGALLFSLEPLPVTDEQRILNQLIPREQNIPEAFYNMLDLLLSHGAKLNSTEVLTPAAFAISQNNPKIFERIIAGSQHPDCRSIRHLPHISGAAIQFIIYRSDVDTFTRVFPSYLQIEDPHILLSIAYSVLLNTPFNTANALTILMLITKKCDLSKPLHNENLTLLSKACMDESTEIVQGLLNSLPLDVNGSTTKCQGNMTYIGWSPLHVACFKGHVDIAKLLISRGANVNQTTPKGASPLHIASHMAQRKNEEKFLTLVEVLKQHGAVNISPVIDKSYTFQNLAAAAMVTAIYQKKRYVLLVRKANQSLAPHGCYLFPGGLVDDEDANPLACAIRETLEETGIDLSGIPGKELVSFRDVIDNTNYQRSFFHFDLGECATLPRISTTLDAVLELGCVDWIDVTQLSHPTNAPLQHANNLMLDMIISGDEIDRDVISKSLHFTLSNSSRNLIVELFHASIAPNDVNIISQQQLWRDKITIFPITELQDKLNQVVEALDKHDMDAAKKIILDVIEELVNSGRLSIDDFRFNIGDEPVPIIFYACSIGDEYCVDRLIQIGADMAHIEQITLEKAVYALSPLCILIESGHQELARRMIDKYKLSLEQTGLIIAPLISACEAENANIEFIKYILDRMISINVQVIGMALQIAIKRHRHDIMEFLLDLQPVNLNRTFLVKSAANFNNIVPLQAAIASFDSQAVKILLEHGASSHVSISGRHTNVMELAKYYRDHCLKKLNERQLKMHYEAGLQSLFAGKVSDEWSSLSESELKEKVTILDEIIYSLENAVVSKVEARH